MDAEIKSCQSCQAEFTIEPEDFAFYQKIDVPPPTWCPDCRAQRRMAWRNEWHLFRKPDAVTGEEIFSGFSPSSPVKVVSNDYWLSDAWDPLNYGRDYDFSKPFFQQFKELLCDVPLPARSILQLENSDYSFNCAYVRNCYLVSAATSTEDSAYVVWDTKSRNCMDTHMTDSCELCYGSLNIENCYQTHYSMNCEGCRDVWFSRDLVACSNCFGCANLHNKQYHIFNQEYSKEEYDQKIAEFKLGSHASLQAARVRVEQFWQTQPNKFVLGSSNESVSGEYIYQSKHVSHGFRVRRSEDSKYCQNILNGPHKDCYDQTNFGENSELVYESMQCGINVYNLQFCAGSYSSDRNLRYSAYCQNSSDLFGCVSVRKGQYCILNKQYSKEEYEALVPKIRQHMNDMPYVDAQGREYRYGEFFPHELSPIEYNLTIAQEELPLTKDQALANGYRWYDRPSQDRQPELEADALPDRADDSATAVVGKVIRCAHQGDCDEECTTVFTIIPQELALLVEQGLPLPRLCPHCRHYSRIAQRRGMKLYSRQCQCTGQGSSDGAYTNTSHDHGSHGAGEPCPTTFQTSFSPEKSDIVYCEACYQAEVL